MVTQEAKRLCVTPVRTVVMNPPPSQTGVTVKTGVTVASHRDQDEADFGPIPSAVDGGSSHSDSRSGDFYFLDS